MQDQTDEHPSPSPSSSSSRSRALGKKIQERRGEEEEERVDPIECTGKSCQSCTAGVIADCVAVCCCPCALVDILAFTFLKIPYLMGRRWLTKGRIKMRSLEKKKKKRKDKTSGGAGDQNGDTVVVPVGGGTGNLTLENEEGVLGIEAMELGNEEIEDHFGAEEEDVWLELYRIGHLGFGRVSFGNGGSSSQRKISNN